MRTVTFGNRSMIDESMVRNGTDRVDRGTTVDAYLDTRKPVEVDTLVVARV